MDNFAQFYPRQNGKLQRKGSFFISDEVGKKVEIFIQCRQLKNVDILSKSDPYVIMKVKKNRSVFKKQDGEKDDKNVWIELGRTNVIQDNLNPNFIESFIVNYKFEEYQPVKFEVWDYDSPSRSNFLGQVECSLGEIVKQPNQILLLNLADEQGKIQYDGSKNPKNGKIMVRYEEVFESNDIVMFQLSTQKVHVSRFILNLFLRIYRKSENGEPILIYQSSNSGKSIKNKTIKLEGQKLCNSDYNVPVVFEVWNKGVFGSEELIGYFEASVNELRDKMERIKEEGLIPVQFKLKQDNRKNAIHTDNSQIGTVTFHKTEVITLPSFLDYLRGGTQINLVIGIDFTGSNKDTSQKNSLHHIEPSSNNMLNSLSVGTMNQYQRAIYAVGKILMEYDQDKLIPTYGFGAEVDGEVRHAFPLNGSQSNPELFGIQCVLDQYKQFLSSHPRFSGPTYFSPLIEKCMAQAQQSLVEKKEDYFVLLILTDGIIHDMEQTKRLIVDCARLPISIIIVGVGGANFNDMNELDGDEGLQDSRGKRAQRDLVQFVEFKKFEGNDILLQKEVLQELPDQIVEYYLLSKRLPEGFEYQPHINYIEFTRIIQQEQSNKQKQNNSPFQMFIHAIIIVAIFIIITNLIF
ncbi:hypothetical protein ABPG72_007206 [Tetrahymena utriculariae]